MIIIAHRGYWLKKSEQNSLVAFERAFKHGFGVELDIRDYREELVVSHNMAKDSSIMLSDLFQLYSKYNDLPFVYGKFTAEKFISFINMINKSNLNYKNIQEIFFFPSGRIDVKTKNNLLIKLPLKNLEEALIRVDKIINSKIFKNNIIDLRVSNQLIISNE